MRSHDAPLIGRDDKVSSNINQSKSPSAGRHLMDLYSNGFDLSSLHLYSDLHTTLQRWDACESVPNSP
jgi:hypothetical protein